MAKGNGSKAKSAPAASPVQPIKVVRGKTEEGSEEAEIVTTNNQPNLQEGQGDKPAPIKESKAKNRASATPVKDKFEEMGVDTSHPDFYNLDLEAERAAAKQYQA